jgi:hypothetical protein
MPVLRSATRFLRIGGKPVKASGLFLCNVPCPRVHAHFDRLQSQTAGLVDWILVPDNGHLQDPRGDEDFVHPSLLMPRRFAAARSAGRLIAGAGMMDIVIMPRVLAAPHNLVWALEFDVDFSGNWADMFSRFARNRADVLTTTLQPRAKCPDWALWSTAQAPAQVDQFCWYRSFAPLQRFSKSFATSYIAAFETGLWGGHYEFIIPTLAHHQCRSIEDIGAPGGWINRFRTPLYHNTPTDETLSPGTFVWRPARANYFHETPHEFQETNQLYHPVKPQ